MRNSFKSILLSLLFLLFLSGIILFIYRVELWDNLTSRAESGLEDVAYKPNISAADTIDISVLDSSVLSSLKQQVNEFDFDNVCYRPTIVIKTSEGTITQKADACIVGNRLPFAVKEIK
ncbi:hypothetical protein JXK06_01650 [Patescibacteria group bacterium]|nr:hypothetical protein [Patescibacteria group bacterium]